MTESAFPPVDAAAWRAQVEHELRGAAWEETLLTKLTGDLSIDALYSERPASFRTGSAPTSKTQLCMPLSSSQLEEDLANGVSHFWQENSASPELKLPSEATLHGGEDGVADALSAQESGADIPLDCAPGP